MDSQADRDDSELIICKTDWNRTRLFLFHVLYLSFSSTCCIMTS